MKKIAIIAGEVSGDILGSRLIRSLKKHYPDLEFEGIGGIEMEKAGLRCLYPMERLSVMGFAEVLSRLFELLKIRKRLVKRWKKDRPDLVIGIDAPDFNLNLEKQLHAVGITAIHYVSPSVWAWREKRVKKMVGNLDLMLTLFPFEADFYHKHKIPAHFVGHPLADEIPLETDKVSARQQLNLPKDKTLIALLPGSRAGEIKRLSPTFLEAASILSRNNSDLHFVIPMVNQKIGDQFEAIREELNVEFPMTLTDGQSRKVMEASDMVLMASGTAVLEGMLVGKPMVAAYKISPITFGIIRLFNMFNVSHFTLPNNLAGEELVTELMQEELTVENTVESVEKLLNDKERNTYRLKRFNELHRELRRGASDSAAKAIVDYFQKK